MTPKKERNWIKDMMFNNFWTCLNSINFHKIHKKIFESFNLKLKPRGGAHFTKHERDSMTPKKSNEFLK